MRNSLRLFVALELSQEIQDQLAQLITRLRNPAEKGIKWVAPKNIHLTLKFLGETPKANLPDLLETIRQCVQTKKRFSLAVYGTGIFPSQNQPRVIWAGTLPNKEVDRLYIDLDHGLAHLGYRSENRPFSPHLTLARIQYFESPSARERLLKNLVESKDKNFGNVSINSVTLFQSTLTSTGPIYSTLHQFPLDN